MTTEKAGADSGAVKGLVRRYTNAVTLALDGEAASGPRTAAGAKVVTTTVGVAGGLAAAGDAGYHVVAANLAVFSFLSTVPVEALGAGLALGTVAGVGALIDGPYKPEARRKLGNGFDAAGAGSLMGAGTVAAGGLAVVAASGAHLIDAAAQTAGGDMLIVAAALTGAGIASKVAGHLWKRGTQSPRAALGE